MYVTDMMIKDTFEGDFLSLKPVWAKYQNPQNYQFRIFLQFAPGIFSTHGQNIVFPKLILWYSEAIISV